MKGEEGESETGEVGTSGMLLLLCCLRRGMTQDAQDAQEDDAGRARHAGGRRKARRAPHSTRYHSPFTAHHIRYPLPSFPSNITSTSTSRHTHLLAHSSLLFDLQIRNIKQTKHNPFHQRQQ